MIFTFHFPGGENRQYKQFKYPGGEVQVRLTDSFLKILKDKTLYEVRVVARVQDGEIVALAQLIDSIKGVSGARVRLILPYLPYARADRRFVEGDCHGIAVYGRMLGMINSNIVTLDAHSAAANRYIPCLTNVSPTPIINEAIYNIKGLLLRESPFDDIDILLPDEGANRYGFTALHATKKRDPETGKLSGFTVPPSSDFKGDAILIVDDICDGGGTFIGIADALKASGNTLPLYLYVTHGIFSKGENELLKKFERIYTTDSFKTSDSYPLQPQIDGRLEVLPCLPTIENGIERGAGK